MRARLGGRAPPCGLGARLRRLRLASIKAECGASARARVGGFACRCVRARGLLFCEFPACGRGVRAPPVASPFPAPPSALSLLRQRPLRGVHRGFAASVRAAWAGACRGQALRRCSRFFVLAFFGWCAPLSASPPALPHRGGRGRGRAYGAGSSRCGRSLPPRAFVCARLCVAGSAAYSIPRCVAGLLLPAGGLLGVPRGGQAPAGRASGGLSPPRDLACARGKRNAAEVRLFCLALAEALPPFPVSPKGESAAQKRMRALCRFGSLIVRFFAAGVFALFFPLYSALSRVSLAAALQPLTAAVLRGRAERKN